jgi:uncharacterized delta-60 repeat protein
MKSKLLIAFYLAVSCCFTPLALAQTTTVEFASASYTANELSGEPLTVTLVSSAATLGDASVEVYIAGGTATLGLDYDVNSQSPYKVAFYGSTNAMVQINALADHLTEPDETIILRLRNPHGVTLGKQTNTTVTIVNGGAAVSFFDQVYTGCVGCGAEQTVSESEKFVTIAVYSVSDTNRPFSVDYTTRDATAKAGVDYTPTFGTLTFAAGETEKTIAIPLSADDGVPGASKVFGLSLTNATAGASIVAGDATVFIQDNEVPANLDYTFKPVTRYLNGDGDGFIHDVAVLLDGKVLIAGWFTQVNGAERSGLACLNVDGSLAQTFQTRLSENSVASVAPLADGRVYIAGDFDSVNGVARPGLARLLLDGSLDSSFAPTNSLWGFIVQTNGGLIGNNGTGLVRLTETGRIDASFVPSVASNWTTAALVEQTDGKLLAASDDGRMIRMNPNGSRDDSFEVLSFESGGATVILVQPDQKILVAGFFTSVNGVPRTNLARLNTDGSLDSGFDADAGVDLNYFGGKIALTQSGKVLVLDQFGNGWRLNADGSLDSSFSGFHSGFLDEPVDQGGRNLHIKAAGAVAYLWGYFSGINGSRVHGLGRILLDAVPVTGMDIQPAYPYENYPNENTYGWNYLEAVGETDGLLRAKIRRLGETTGPATVTYMTRDLTAKAGKDYVATNGTLSFAPLELEKFVTVPILDNATLDGPRTFQLFLTNGIGADFLAPPLTMTIFDDELGFEPGAIARLPDGTTQISFRVLPNTTYQLEVSSDLKTWTTLGNEFGGSAFSQIFYDGDITNHSGRFYRIRTP